LIVNAIGSFVLGVATALLVEGHLSADALLLIGTGFCGALTTFSTFSLEVCRALARGAIGDGIRVVAHNTVTSFALAVAGYASVSVLA
jgi:CrcB protein